MFNAVCFSLKGIKQIMLKLFKNTICMLTFLVLTSNVNYAQDLHNKFSLHLLTGLPASEQEFSFAGFANVLKKDVKCLQFLSIKLKELKEYSLPDLLILPIAVITHCFSQHHGKRRKKLWIKC